MSEPRLIQDYLASLSAQLPAEIAEELADGLGETYHFYLRQGLAPERAAQGAVAEFGEPHVILADFSRANPARRAARRLLWIGPGVGACWAAALIAGHAWTWPLPLPARILPGLAVITVIALLAVAAFGTRYRLAARAGIAGCVGTVVLDTLMIIGVALAVPSMTWVVAGAMTASALRIAVSARSLRPVPAR
jgi:hypothetical protein